MAQAVVSVVLETIRSLLLEEVKLQQGVRDQVEEIKAELIRIQCFLKDADCRQYEDERIRNQVSEVREAAYDIEDNIIEYFSVKVESIRRRNSRNMIKVILGFFNQVIVTHRVGNQIMTIKGKIDVLTERLQTYGVKAVSDGESSSRGDRRKHELRRAYSHELDDHFVGLEEDIKLLASHLLNEDHYRVVSIWGMGGLGKTTMARKLYNHRHVRRYFDDFAWTCVSQQWDKKDILQGILIKLMPEKREVIVAMRDEELVRQLHQVQVDKKCLVVLDDIWSIQAWDALKSAFPTFRTGSKILLTTRNKEVALHVSHVGFLYNPRFLLEEESWELLQKKAFPRRDHTGFSIEQDMEHLGREMVKHCCGLPLAIVVLGGLLAKRDTLRQWQNVHQSINWYLAKGEGHEKQAVTNVLAFSYHDLPYKFKQCFLYLANFPEDCEINAEKLYQLWLAEGIISSDDLAEEETMMDVAERYLSELAQRCLVQIRLKETTGSFKTCRLHDLMRDLCMSKVREENFTKIIDFRHQSMKLMDSEGSSVHRVSMYIGGANSKGIIIQTAAFPEYVYHTRSVFIYANDCRGTFWKSSRFFFSEFKLLRVLDLQGFCDANDQLPESIGGLIHLRYLSIRNSIFKKLPSSLGRLKYLQTLDLEVTCFLVQIPNVLWKLERLRHLYLPTQFYTKDGSKLKIDGLINLETLINFDTSLCDVKDLDGLTNLRKLRTKIKEKLEDLPMIIDYLSFKPSRLRRFSLSLRRQEFSSSDELSSLTELLGCPRLNKLFICGRIEKLPHFSNFSPSLTKLSFQGSQLLEDAMEILEKLPKLSSLTFFSSSFVGKEMVCSAMGFPQLKYLKLWDLMNLERWKMMSEGAMPNLSRLVIAYCDKLEMLPDGLQFISTLQKLNVRWMPKAFKNRLRTVNGFEGEDFYKVRHVPEVKLD